MFYLFGLFAFMYNQVKSVVNYDASIQSQEMAFNINDNLDTTYILEPKDFDVAFSFATYRKNSTFVENFREYLSVYMLVERFDNYDQNTQ